MDVMEKLVELIGSTEYGNGYLVGNNFQKGFIEKIASHLIDNGVTVQENTEISDELLQRLRNAPITVITEETSDELVQELDGCEYCNGLPFSQMEDFTMPNASKKDYDIVTIRFCPMCGRKLPQPPKGE